MMRMRDSWRALRLLVVTSVRVEPWRSAAALLEPLGVLAFPLMAVGLRFVTDGVLAGDAKPIVVGIVLIAGVQPLMGVVSFVGTSMRLALRERVGFAFDLEVSRLTATIPGVEHHERADYQDRLELIRQSHGALAGSLNSVINLVTATIGVIGMLVVLTIISPVLLLLLIFALPAVPVAGLQLRWQREAEAQSATASRLSRHFAALTIDRNAGMEARVFGLADELRGRLRGKAMEARAPYLRADRRSTLLHIGRQAIFTVGYVGAVGVVLWQAARGRATVGDVVAAAYICRQVAAIAVAPIFAVAGLGQALNAAGQLLWLREYAASVGAHQRAGAPPPDRLTTGIVFDNVSFKYPGTERWALRDVSFVIPPGTVMALVGENGAGKTTIVKLLCRMYTPTSGRILVDGVDLAETDVEQWRSRLSGAFQDFVRFELSPQRAVGVGDLPRLDDAAAVTSALERAGAGAAAFAGALPAGLQTQLGSGWDDGVDISTGQWQKLALARALMREQCLIVLFDEPTASLDALTEHELFARYAEAARAGSQIGAVTVLVSHRFSTVRSADLIGVLDEGRMVEIGSHEELLARAGLYAELYGLQVRLYE
jgi:ATP-binding cassette subfamily B protein